MYETEEMQCGARLLAAIEELNELASAVERQGERTGERLTDQAERFALARRVKTVAKEVVELAEAYLAREQDRLWRMMEAQDIKSARVELSDGTYTIVRALQTYPGLNYDVVDRDDPVQRKQAIEKILEFFRQTGDYPALVDESPSIIWSRARRKDFYERWLREESEGKLSIPPELNLNPQPVIQLRKARQA